MNMSKEKAQRILLRLLGVLFIVIIGRLASRGITVAIYIEAILLTIGYIVFALVLCLSVYIGYLLVFKKE